MNHYTNDNYSLDAVVDFIQSAIKKGLIKENTGNARLSAINKILFGDNLLSAEETQDIRKIDLEDVFHKFSNLHPSDLLSGSFKTYKSRLTSSFKDFLKYRKDPANFKPRNRLRKHSSGQKTEVTQAVGRVSEDVKENRSNIVSPRTYDFPIPLRNGELVILLKNLPFDLSSEEAEKINGVILALAKEVKS